MARIIQVLFPLLALFLADAQHLHIPFLDNIPGLHHPHQPTANGPKENQVAHNAGFNGYNTWFQHFGNPDAHQFSSESHEIDKSFEDYDPYFHGDPYFQGFGWNHMPGINNVFNLPKPGHNAHKHQPPHSQDPKEKSKEVHTESPNSPKIEDNSKEGPPVDKKPIEQDKGPKLTEVNTPDEQNKFDDSKIIDIKNSSDLLPPKTNKIKKEDDKGEKDDKQVDMDKKKDFLLVGQGNNPNNVYLLHENNPNPNTVVTPNGNQPGNNIIYIPYNPGQSNNQVYQLVNGQPNIQMAPDKLSVPNTNLNTGTQNPGYVTVYSNGQLIQIPGVVVNSVPNNAPLQNGNQVQGQNYIIANADPSNTQTVQAVQNPGSNIIYAAIPNQPSSVPAYIQIPNCMNVMSNACNSGGFVQSPVQGVNNGISNNGLPSNVVVYQANPVSPNSYVQPNMVANQGQGTITVAIPNNQNVQYQAAVQIPANSGSNVYSQPIVSNLGQGQNVPNQGGMTNTQNMLISTVQVPIDSSSNGYNQPAPTNPGQNVLNQGEKQQIPYQPNQNIQYQTAVLMPVNSGTNGYIQPVLSNPAPVTSAPIQGITINNQNTPQAGIEIPIPSGYGHPLITNPIVDVESRGDVSSNQNAVLPTVPVNGNSNDQGTKTNVNTPSNTEVISQESDTTQPLATSSIVLDSNNLASLGAQPAIMIADFKDKADEEKGEKKNSSKEKKEKKDKGKKKDKKPKDDDKPKVSEPFTNKKK
ncbi:hypothetical protein PYW08_007950 [Mythimna loreyi]|uniref:Uncharacterized protein n=1 Tax=Mythimna loreyi TaxID=667449 RepID=A0ACC2QAK4_9NEOP|nr:hypothetical protein PYW08_007950 [Mythimna loreyi]